MSAILNDPHFLAWLRERPEAVRRVVESHPPDCYRLTGSAGHYWISAYSEPADGSGVTVKLVHGADSNLPGVEVYGIHPDELAPCSCGAWKPPTRKQALDTRARIGHHKAIRERRARQRAMAGEPPTPTKH